MDDNDLNDLISRRALIDALEAVIRDESTTYRGRHLLSAEGLLECIREMPGGIRLPEEATQNEG